MSKSKRVALKYISLAEKALYEYRYCSKTFLASSLGISRSTITNFFNGKPVSNYYFVEICEKLGLDWQTLAEEEEPPLSLIASLNPLIKEEEIQTEREKIAYAIAGSVAKADVPKLKAILALLQEVTEDTSLKIVEIEKGSIRLILGGSQESLQLIEYLFKSGELTEVCGIPVEDVRFLTRQMAEGDEDIKSLEKKQLAFTLVGSISPREIEKLKAAFTEISDNDEQVKTDEKFRLVQGIISKRTKGRKLRGADLSAADLSGSYLIAADLRDANLRDANLRDADLRGANLSHANLRDADLSDADLIAADLRGANLSHANLWGARINTKTKTDPKWILVRKLVTQGGRQRDLRYADLKGADLSAVNLSAVNLKGADLRGANLRGANLSTVNLSAANLSTANLSAVNLSAANLKAANLRGADLRGANLRGANLRGADLSDADLSDADLSDADLGYANLSDANLSDANLSDANLSHANLWGARINTETKTDSKWLLVWRIVTQGGTQRDLRYADLSAANLRDGDLSDANLRDGDLSDANLKGANLSDANLKGANLSDADLRGAYLCDANLSDADLRGAYLCDANLRGANLSAADLRSADLIAADLKGANLSDANLIESIVVDTQLGEGLGLSEDMKIDLKRRGAIFDDSLGNRDGVLNRR